MQNTQKQNRMRWNIALALVPLLPMLAFYWQNKLVWIVLAGITVLFLILALISVVVTRSLAKLPLNTAMNIAS